MISPYAKEINNSVLNHSYDKLLCFWTHWLNFFNIFCDFHKNMLDNVFSILHMVEPLVGDMVCQASVFMV